MKFLAALFTTAWFRFSIPLRIVDGLSAVRAAADGVDRSGLPAVESTLLYLRYACQVCEQVFPQDGSCCGKLLHPYLSSVKVRPAVFPSWLAAWKKRIQSWFDVIFFSFPHNPPTDVALGAEARGRVLIARRTS